MPIATLSSKYQITLPMEVVRTFQLVPGDKLIVEAMEWRIVIMKESENRLERYIGSLKGVYGKTVEEIDRYVREERASWDRTEWLQQFYDIMQRDDDAMAFVNWLLERPGQKCTDAELGAWWGKLNWTYPRLEELKDKFLRHGGLRKIPPSEARGGDGPQYYIVPDVVVYLTSKVLA